MNILPREEIRTLMNVKESPCVSIYLSIPVSGDPSRQAQIRLKNAIKESETSLSAYGMDEKMIVHLTKPLRELATTVAFMDEISSTLAVFLSPGSVKYYWLPIETREMVNVSERFHLKPLLDLFSGSEQYYLLALSQKKVRLFKGSRYALTEFRNTGLPEGLKDALNYEEREKTLQKVIGRSAGRGGTGKSPGHGAGYDLLEEELEQYARVIDKGLSSLLKGQKGPLVIAAVEEEIALFSKISSYPVTLEKGIPGNPDELSAHELHKLSWEIMEPYFAEERRKILHQFRELEGSALTDTDILKILPAAYNGKVQSVFLARDIQKWGIFNTADFSLEIHNARNPGDQDLLDEAAYLTLMNGGDVYILESESMPGNANIAALYRYI